MLKRYAAALAAALTVGGTALAQSPDMKIRSVEKWGDAMGDAKGVSTKVVSYYNSDNLLISETNYGADYSTKEFTPSRFTVYEYNDKKQLVKKYSQQYGQYDDLDFMFKASVDTVYYSYNDAGQLICERNIQSKDSIVYEYDEDGNKTRYAQYVPDYYGTVNNGNPYVMKEERYSDFVAHDCPQKIIGDGRYDGDKVSYDIAYDADFNMISKKKFNSSDVPTQNEYWTYENGQLVTYVKYNVTSTTDENGETAYTEVPSSKTEYSVIQEEPLRIKEQGYTYNKSKSEWGANLYYNVSEYFTPEAASAPELTVEKVADKLNTAKLTFNATSISGVSNVAYDIMRHGFKIARLTADDAVGGQITYIDEEVKNGDYDYFVQAVDADADKSGEDVLNSYGYGMNTSNLVKTNFYTALPAVTNLHKVKVEYADDQCFVTLKWDEPKNKENYKFIKYYVFFKGMKRPCNENETLTTNTYKLSIGDGTENDKIEKGVYVQAVYAIGKANGDTIQINNKVYSLDGYKARSVEKWGDAMGTATGISTKEVSYYNANNLLVSDVTYGADYETGDFIPSRFYVYVYNDKKQLIKKYSQQYGLYDGEDMAYKASNDTVLYTYNEDGKLICERNTQSNDSIIYEYDADGNKTRYARYMPDYYGTMNGGLPYVMNEERYSDFVAPDCPTKIVGDGKYDSYKFTVDVAYDDKNNVISKKQYDINGAPTQNEYWEYENGLMTLYTKYTVKSVKDNNGEDTYEEVPSTRTEYSLESEEPMRIKEQTYSYNKTDSTWGANVYYFVTEYYKPESTTAPTLKVEKVADKLNTVKLTFNATTIDGVQNVAYDIMRHGIKIARLTGENAVDGKITYIDEYVKNGDYKYFVQAVDADADKSGDDALFSYGFGMNTSDLVSSSVYTELPAATNVRGTAVEYVDGQCFVTLTWDEPENKDDYMFVKYNVFLKGMRVQDNQDQTLTTNSYKIAIGWGDENTEIARDIYVQTVYTIGKANSDTVTISNKNIDTAIDAVSAGDDFQFSNGIVTVGNGAKMDVYTANGTIIAIGRKESIDLNGCPAGIYVVKVNNNGVTTIHKVVAGSKH